MNNHNDGSESQILTTALVINWALVASVFIYGLLTLIAIGPGDPKLDDSIRQLALVVLPLVSLLNIGFGLFFRSRYMDPDTLTTAESPEESAQTYLKGVIIQGGLFESIAVYGLLLAFLFESVLIFLPFAAVALVLLLLLRPTRSDYEKRLKQGQ